MSSGTIYQEAIMASPCEEETSYRHRKAGPDYDVVVGCWYLVLVAVDEDSPRSTSQLVDMINLWER